ncbi:MmgE/PrpD family protein [Bosea sp. BK604]|uniref:MmgE/PrpD family protein n=1 Tax=Bosea sp. BK604 TaxID=2512180 RepID=UPI001044246F|nr:MmgE/PrpD family protein [Bosea sp. BK604]TCR62999.1 2-methylcitrate dehydratase PrpD [Bosea sp. BK604]
MSLATAFAQFCHDSAGRPLPKDVSDRARLCFIDHLHAVLYGLRSETGDLLRAYLPADATGLSGEQLALCLGAASTVDEIDDVHFDTSLHTGSVVVAAAIAATRYRPVPFDTVLAAIAVGYDVAVRLGVIAGPSHYRYFHTTATCGAIGAAAAASVVLGLSRDQIRNAIGIAATSASGLWEGISTEAIGLKHMHSGFAAERAVRSARLAGLGLKASPASLDGQKGFLNALDAEADGGDGLDAKDRYGLHDLGQRWSILRNIFKRYPFCLGCFEPLEGVKALLAAAKRPLHHLRRVDAVLCPPTAELVSVREPGNLLAAKFSVQFAIALVLAGYPAEQVRPPAAWLSDPDVGKWYPLIHSGGDPSLPPRFARVTLTWDDGTRQEGAEPLSNLSVSDVERRFAAVCASYDGAAVASLQRLATTCASADDVAGLAHLLAGIVTSMTPTERAHHDVRAEGAYIVQG